MKIETGKLLTLWERGKFALPVLGLGVLLLLWPGGEEGFAVAADNSLQQTIEDRQEEMERILSRIEGVGELYLMLTLESDGERTLAVDGAESLQGDGSALEERQCSRETVILSADSGEEVVVTERRSPIYRGALVVCQGADRAEVKLAVTQAVSALTGLGTDRITVVKCQ